MSESKWVQAKDIRGGLVVFCTLCGKETRRSFHADSTNYAECRRLATAYHWKHEHSEMHTAALAAFHADEVPEATSEDRLMAEIFDRSLPTERALRRRAARRAAYLNRNNVGQ